MSWSHYDFTQWVNSGCPVIFEGMNVTLRVRELDMSRSGLSTFPREILNLRNLVDLDLSHNSIGDIPRQINKLAKLQTIKLGHNRLISVPSEIALLPNLTELYLNNNQLTSAPPVRRLKIVDLNSNYL
jgi:Leucine-rich repeat (LRR) protein